MHTKVDNLKLQIDEIKNQIVVNQDRPKEPWNQENIMGDDLYMDVHLLGDRKMNLESELGFDEMVTTLAKPGQNIINELTPESAHNLHMAIGVAGEAGELLDAVKKSAIYNKPIDRANVIEELGDIEFYLQGLRVQLKITRRECLEANIAKLSKRYEGLKYSNESAQLRADKA